MAIIDLKPKTCEQLQFEITKLNTDIFLKDKEIERLNNIINELEKELNKDFTTYLQKDTTMRETGKTYKAGANNYRMHIYLKLQKLKGSDKE